MIHTKNPAFTDYVLTVDQSGEITVSKTGVETPEYVTKINPNGHFVKDIDAVAGNNVLYIAVSLVNDKDQVSVIELKYLMTEKCSSASTYYKAETREERMRMCGVIPIMAERKKELFSTTPTASPEAGPVCEQYSTHAAVSADEEEVILKVHQRLRMMGIPMPVYVRKS